MNSPDALLVYQLLKDYHREVAPALKTLGRLLAAGPLSDPSLVETERVAATGWFNQVATLYLRGLIDERTFRTVASPRAAALWVELVAPLDREVRRAAGGEDAANVVTMVERLWRDFAEGHLPTMQFVFGVSGVKDGH